MAKLSDTHHAIMWISTKGAALDDEKEIVEVARKVLGDEISFVGFCFGRFDLILEFSHESARVASYKVCKLQEGLDGVLKAKGNHNSICSSLTICSMIAGEPDFDKKLRVYSFLRPKDSELDLDALEEIVLKLSGENDSLSIQLGWNTSMYSFLLVVGGDKFSEAFDVMQKFRGATKDYFSDSCTYVGVNWDSVLDEDDVEIHATSFVRTEDGFGWLELSEVDKKIWNPRSMRFGWSDICLFTRSKSLLEIKQRVLDIRKNYPSIKNTSTLLLPKWVEDGE